MTGRTPDHDRHDRDDDRDLRRLLEDAVADVEPAPALDTILTRTRDKDTTMSDSRPWIYGFVGAAAATAAVVAGVAVFGGPDPVSTSDPASTPTVGADRSTPPDPTPSEDPPASPDESEEAPQATVPVYYVGDTPTGPRLFREFHRVAAPAGEPTAAVSEALSAAPLDPDYRTPWADLGVTVQSVESAGGALTVDLVGGAPADRPAGLGAEEASLAVKQLVWTVTAAAQDDTSVRFTVGGSPADRLLGVSVGDGARRGAPMDTLALVWVTSPQDGETVGSSFTVEGQGAFFEANVSWELLDSGGQVVQDGFTTARECCTLAPYTFDVEDVSPGDYTLRVYSADASGGEGPGEPEDTKRLTVR